MPRKVPEIRLQGLHDALRLVELLSSNKRPFDSLDGLCDLVRWRGDFCLSRRLRHAKRWIAEQARRQGYKLRHDGGATLPPTPKLLTDGRWVPDDPLIKRIKQEAIAELRRKQRAEKRAARKPKLREEHPWLFP